MTDFEEEFERWWEVVLDRAWSAVPEEREGIIEAEFAKVSLPRRLSRKRGRKLTLAQRVARDIEAEEVDVDFHSALHRSGDRWGDRGRLYQMLARKRGPRRLRKKPEAQVVRGPKSVYRLRKQARDLDEVRDEIRDVLFERFINEDWDGHFPSVIPGRWLVKALI